ncbi:homeobox vent1-like protein [Labeo rohita]|uniref:Homeobox protein vent1 n=2 Tax=Labeo rohita TaxID=84645 RepID=A0ABQ8M5H4_LABRO|nr:ventral expressed homeobox [Labeo rohita]KAI2658149.1 Homeobox protein vent1 [Labeo rohita]RXN09389.1 homeobox vent1-like protein [Labeo rohita]
MFKKFSVEWLSQSFHAQDLDREKCFRNAPNDAFSDAPHASSDAVGEGETKAPSSPTNSCGYTSASESDESEGESGPQRRVRTKFSSDQISRLEKTFSKHKYLGATQRRKIAEKLQLSETQVKTWFQNRRMKLKREVQDMRAAEFFVPTVLPSVTSLQHQAMSGQRTPLYYPPQSLQRIPAPQMPPQPRLHPMLFAPCYF